MPAKPLEPEKSLEEIVAQVGLYPIEAFHFIQAGLEYTATKAHGERKEPEVKRHITGQQLSEGLREFALLQWGLLARTVLKRWNINRTDDFGRIVFALVENRYMSKTHEDRIEDFKNVYDFRKAFEEGYRIECKS